MPLERMMGLPQARVLEMQLVLGDELEEVEGVMMGTLSGVLPKSLGFLEGLPEFQDDVIGGLGRLNGELLGGMLMGLEAEIYYDSIRQASPAVV